MLVASWCTLGFVALHVLFGKPFCFSVISHDQTLPRRASAVVIDSVPFKATSPGAGLR
jgi:hypothetical protein